MSRSQIKKIFSSYHIGYSEFYVYCLVALPLFYLPNYQVRAMSMRLLLLLLLSAFALSSIAVLKLSAKNIRNLPIVSKICLAIFSLLVFVTAIYQGIHGNLYWIGIAPLYIGLLLWICILVLAIVCKGNVQTYITNRVCLCIGTTSLFLSLFFDFYSLHGGLRLAGLLYQPTNMAMYSCIIGCIALATISREHDKMWRTIGTISLLITSTCIMATQSRVGILVFTSSLLIWAIHRWGKQKSFSILLIGLTVILVSLPFVYPAYFSRLHSQSLKHGTGYRFDLYSISSKELVSKNIVLGNGPATFPKAINQPKDVPPDIAMTLGIGNKFASTHNLFLDVAYFFGDAAAIALAVLVIYAPIYYVRLSKKPQLAYILIFGTLLANALFNVPSLELTSLFFVVVFGLFVIPISIKSQH